MFLAFWHYIKVCDVRLFETPKTNFLMMQLSLCINSIDYFQLSWHPKKEGLLAYGTDDGRVGIYDTLSNK